MATIWSWSSSADADFSGVLGAAHTLETAGSYGQRKKWAAQVSVAAYGYRTLAISGDHSMRFIYTHVARPSTSFMIAGGWNAGTFRYRADLTATGLIRIRDASTTVSTGTVALALNTEYRIELSRSGTTLTFKAYRVSDNVLIDSITGTVPGTALTELLLGNQAPITGTYGPYTYDEIIARDVAGEIGPVAGANVAPTANAGPDQSNIEPYDLVTLAGSVADSDGTATGVWSKVSGPTPIGALSSTTSMTPTYRGVPTAITAQTDVWRLTPTDNLGLAGTPDDVSIAMLAVSERACVGGVEVPLRLKTAY